MFLADMSSTEELKGGAAVKEKIHSWEGRWQTANLCEILQDKAQGASHKVLGEHHGVGNTKLCYSQVGKLRQSA